MSHRLPPQYAALERFVATWSLPDSASRSLQRAKSTEQEREEFFNAVRGHIDSALNALDQKPLRALNEQEQCLLNLLLSFAHVALAIEIQGSAEEQHACGREALRFV